MPYYIGVDLGTSSVKTLLLSENGIEKTVSFDYPVSIPKEGWSEQNPLHWREKTFEAIKELTQGIDKSLVKSISFSGQMHGLVLLDKDNNVIRPAILWNDGRSEKEAEYLNNVIGKEELLKLCGNIAFAGFTAPKILWVKENEPENFARINKILLPKDYILFTLTGKYYTDVSDASGTLYFDVENRKWSEEMLGILSVSEDMLPKVRESYEAVSRISEEAAKELGLPADVTVAAGAGDNAAAAVGAGAVSAGDCNISLGTSGTIFVVSDKFSCDTKNAIHSFCSASGSYHQMACMLSAASCMNWWIKDIMKSDDFSLPENVKPGENEIYFLPYLSGERSPYNNPSMRAVFFGMSVNTKREDMTLAVLEGVAFALKQNLEIIRSHGITVNSSRITGGGAKNSLWLKIIASALEVELHVPVTGDCAALGGALLGAKSVMPEEDYECLTAKLYRDEKVIYPDKELAARYNEKYEKFLRITDFQINL